MRIFNLYVYSPSLHLVSLWQFGKRFTYCQACRLRDRKLCHKICSKHNKPYYEEYEMLRDMIKGVERMAEDCEVQND